MINRLLSLALALALLGSCSGKEPQPGEPGKNEICQVLDSLFLQIQALETSLGRPGTPWAELKPGIQSILEGLQKITQVKDSTCNYLNHRIHPEVDRFSFVETIRNKIIRDTVSDGIYYLVRLRGIFASDEEIQEFFSEEIAYVAYRNPVAYLAYMERDPGQREMLLNSTRWSIVRSDTLLSRFGRVKGGELVTTFLEHLSQKNDESEF